MEHEVEECLDIDEDTDNFICEFAEKNGMTYSEAVNFIIKWYLANKESVNGGC